MQTTPDNHDLSPAGEASDSATFPVDWIRLFKSLSKHLTLTIIGITIVAGVARWVRVGFNVERTFQHMSVSAFFIALVAAPFVSVAMAFLIAYWCKGAGVILTKNEIQGCNVWGRKKRIPLADISALRYCSQHGFNSYIVTSRQHGTIYISDHTKCLEELLEFLKRHLPEAGNNLPSTIHASPKPPL